MKKLTILLMILMFASPAMVYSQDITALRAARRSFRDAQDNYQDGNYEKAIQEYNIVINTIPARIERRRDLVKRLKSLVNLIDIYFSKHVDISKACKYIQIYKGDLDIVKNSGVLRTSQLLEFLKKAKEFESEYIPICERYKKSDEEFEEYRKKFEKEFDDK